MRERNNSVTNSFDDAYEVLILGGKQLKHTSLPDTYEMRKKLDDVQVEIIVIKYTFRKLILEILVKRL